jgi:uncharacterized protein HemX
MADETPKMTVKGFFTLVWSKVTLLWSTKAGRIILAVLVIGGVGTGGYMGGCFKQLIKTKTVEEQLDEAKKAQKEMQKQIVAKDEEIKKLQIEILKKKKR